MRAKVTFVIKNGQPKSQLAYVLVVMQNNKNLRVTCGAIRRTGRLEVSRSRRDTAKEAKVASCTYKMPSMDNLHHFDILRKISQQKSSIQATIYLAGHHCGENATPSLFVVKHFVN